MRYLLPLRIILTIASLLLVSASCVFAQWERVEGPPQGDIVAIVGSEQSLWTVTASGAIYYRTLESGAWRFVGGVEGDPLTERIFSLGGDLWINKMKISSDGQFEIVKGLPDGAHVTPSSTGLFAITGDCQVWQSPDTGRTWAMVGNGAMPPGVERLYGDDAAIIQDSVILAVQGHSLLLRSANLGQTWRLVDTSMIYAGVYGMRVVAAGKLVLARGRKGVVYKSFDKGATWIPISGLPSYPQMYGLTAHDGAYRIYSDKGVFQSDAMAMNWTRVDVQAPISSEILLTSHPIHLLISPIIMQHRKTVYLGTPYGLYQSSDKGDTWQRLSRGISDPSSISTMISNRVMALPTALVVADNYSIWRSTNNGISWTEALFVDDRKSDVKFQDITMLGPGAIGTISRSTGNLWISTDNGQTWRIEPIEELQSSAPPQLLGYDGSAYALFPGMGTSRTTDGGMSWTVISTSFPPGRIHATPRYLLSTDVFNDVTYSSSDHGVNWEVWDDLLGPLEFGTKVTAVANDPLRQQSYVATFKSGLLISTAGGPYIPVSQEHGSSMDDIRDIAIDTLTDRVFAAGKIEGVSYFNHYSEYREWYGFDEGFPMDLDERYYPQVMNLRITGDMLVAFTNRGVFIRHMRIAGVDDRSNVSERHNSLSSQWRNGQLEVQLPSGPAGNYEILVFTIAGQQVVTTQQYLGGASGSVVVPTTRLAPGLYVIQVARANTFFHSLLHIAQ